MMRRVLVMDLRTILMMVLRMILMRDRKLTINCGGCRLGRVLSMDFREYYQCSLQEGVTKGRYGTLRRGGEIILRSSEIACRICRIM